MHIKAGSKHVLLVGSDGVEHHRFCSCGLIVVNFIYVRICVVVVVNEVVLAGAIAAG